MRDELLARCAASESSRCLRSLLRQGVLITIEGQTQIIPAPDAIYDLDPTPKKPPPVGQLLSIDRGPEDHPVR